MRLKQTYVSAFLSLLCIGASLVPESQTVPRIFTVTAVGWDGTETVPSNAVTVSNYTAQLAWDHPNLAAVMHFHLYVRIGTFTRSFNVGRELTVHWPITQAVVDETLIVSALLITKPTEPAMFFALCYRTNLLEGGWIPIQSATITRTNL